LFIVRITKTNSVSFLFLLHYFITLDGFLAAHRVELAVDVASGTRLGAHWVGGGTRWVDGGWLVSGTHSVVVSRLASQERPPDDAQRSLKTAEACHTG
jgi:hypothetical protein